MSYKDMYFIGTLHVLHVQNLSMAMVCPSYMSSTCPTLFQVPLERMGIPRLPTGCPRLPELCQIPLERIEQPRPCRKYLTAVLACHEPSLSLNWSSLPRRLDPPISQFNFAQIFVANTFVLKGVVHCQRGTGRAGRAGA